jgi:hypothetical protein
LTSAIQFVWTIRYFAFCGAILLAGLTLPSQSAEVLRTYWFDGRLDIGHASWLAVALAYAGCIFAMMTVNATADPQNREERVFGWVVTAALVTPLVLVISATTMALLAWRDVALVRQSVILGVGSGVAVLAMLLSLIWWCERRTTAVPFSNRLCKIFDWRIAKAILDLATLVFLVGFLAIPQLPPADFIHMATRIGALPSILVSLAVVMYVIYRLTTFKGGNKSARVVLFIIAAILLAVLANQLERRSVLLTATALGALILVGWELFHLNPSYRTAILALLGLFVLLLGLGDIATTTKVRVTKRTADPSPVLATAFDEWLRSRADIDDYKGADGKPMPYPVLIVAAQGGGLYAAYHAAMVLSHMQDRCPRFAQHLFAISGVSGGSLGAATFVNAVEQLRADQSRAACDPKALRTEFRDYSDRFLKRDFLSPLVFMAVIPSIAQRALALAPDWLLQRLPGVDLGAYDRARGLEYSFETAAAETDRLDGRSGNFFRTGMLSTWRPQGVTPALVLNITRSDTGEPYWIAPFRMDVVWPGSEIDGVEVGDIDVRQKVLAIENPNIDVSVATAVTLSARFPFVTPPGTLDVAGHRWLEKQVRFIDNKFQRVGFVDGGYSENSGLESAWRLALVIKDERDKHAAPIPVSLNIIAVGDIWGFHYGQFRTYQLPHMGLQWFPAEYADRLPVDDLTSPAGSELLAPALALNASRKFRAWHGLLAISANVEAMKQDTATKIVASRDFFGLTAETNPLPLGWVLTSQTFSRVRAREYLGVPGQPCNLSLAERPILEAEMKQLREYGEDVSAFVDRWMYGCAAAPIRRLLSPAPQTVAPGPQADIPR